MKTLEYNYRDHLDYQIMYYTLKTGMPVEEGDSILKLLRRVSRPDIQLGVGIHSELDGIYFSSQEQIAYFPTQEAVYFLAHFKFLRAYVIVFGDQFRKKIRMEEYLKCYIRFIIENPDEMIVVR